MEAKREETRFVFVTILPTNLFHINTENRIEIDPLIRSRNILVNVFLHVVTHFQMKRTQLRQQCYLLHQSLGFIQFFQTFPYIQCTCTLVDTNVFMLSFRCITSKWLLSFHIIQHHFLHIQLLRLPLHDLYNFEHLQMSKHYFIANAHVL